VSLRHDRGWSQEELADRIGCASSLVHKWEQYKRVPSNFLLICWMDALEAQVEIKTK
jgi:ribosome-binding protein aMBF1 (putative translation factor)